VPGIVDVGRVALPQVGLRAWRWHLNHYLRRNATPVICGMYLTNRCPLRCKMCTLATDPAKRTMRLDVFEEAVAALGTMGCQYISIAGGEPLVVDEAVSYLAAAKRHIPVVHVVTSGYTVDRALARQIGGIAVDSVAVSLDGFEHTHDSIRGVTGAYARAVRALRLLKQEAPGVELTVNSVIMPENVAELKDLVLQSERLGARHKFQPVNYHPQITPECSPHYDWAFDKRTTAKLRELLAWAQSRRSVSNGAYFLAHVHQYLVGKQDTGLLPDRCLLPYFFCQMRENERLYPCLTGLDWRGGVSLEHGLRAAYFSLTYRRLQKSLERCRRCQSNMQICYVEPRAIFPLGALLRYETPAWLKARLRWNPASA
jgi:MoaA/NifB/PqqE/SkfB family radical SAM enzyme